MARILGLDLGTYAVKAVGLSTTLRGFQIAGYWEEPVPPAKEGEAREQVQAAAARALFQAKGLHPDTVVCGVPGASALVRLLHLPFVDPKKIEQVVPFEVDEQIPFDLDEVVFDHQVVASGEAGADVLVAAMRKGELARLLEALKAAGIDPRVMCLDTLPYLYLAREILPAEVGPYAILDLGHVHTSVSILGQGALQYVRTLTRGGLAVTEAIAKDLEVDLAEAEAIKHRHGGWDMGPGQDPGGESARVRAAIDRALRPLLSDLRQTFQAHAAMRRGRVEKVFLCGGTSRLRGVDSMLAANLGVEVIHLRPLQGPFASFAGPDVPADVLPKALSLALRALAPGRGAQMNLRKGEFGFRGDFQFLRGRVIQLAAWIGAILVLAGAYAFARYHTLSSQAEAQKRFLAEVTRQTLGEEVTEFSVAHNRITRGGARATLGELLPQMTALDYLNEISRNIGKERLDVKRLDVAPKRISLEGEVDSVEALDAIEKSLTQFKCFAPTAAAGRPVEKNVRVVDSRKNQLNNRISFKLLITPTC